MEIVHLIISLSAEQASLQVLLKFNREQWGIEIMHRHKDVTLGEQGYANRGDNAPRNVFTILCFVFKILKSISPSPTRAIEASSLHRHKDPTKTKGPEFFTIRPRGDTSTTS
ncbi:MAG: hypothetical protein ACLQBA_09285 [Candidatus Binataceae bacterium]